MFVDKYAYERKTCSIALLLWVCVYLSYKNSIILLLIWQNCFLDFTIYLGDLFTLVDIDALSHFFQTLLPGVIFNASLAFSSSLDGLIWTIRR